MLKIYIYVILICLLLFIALIGSGELCFSSLVLFGIKIYMYFMSDAPVGMSWQLPDPFTILQFNANGIGNTQTELGDFLERH